MSFTYHIPLQILLLGLRLELTFVDFDAKESVLVLETSLLLPSLIKTYHDARLRVHFFLDRLEFVLSLGTLHAFLFQLIA